MASILFLVIAAIGLATALGTVLSRNLVRAGLYLVAFFFAVACLFVLLEAEFLAAIQVLVYIGAVAILLMFGIMLTRDTLGDDTTAIPIGWMVPGLFGGLCVFAVLVVGINNSIAPSGWSPWEGTTSRPSIAKQESEPDWVAERREAVNDMGRVIGVELMTRYVVAFELAGLLLTAALVGAIALAHRGDPEPRPPIPGERVAGSVAGDGDGPPSEAGEPVASPVSS